MATDRLRRAVANSHIASELDRLLGGSRDHSSDHGFYETMVTRVGGWAHESTAVAVGQRVSTALEQGIAGTGIGGAVRSVGSWIRSSYLYRWLTAEPDPDVVVIDLRETVTVGPLIAGLERTGEVLATTRDSSTAYSVGRSMVERVQAAPIRVFSLALLTLLVIQTGLGAVLGPFEFSDIWTRIGIGLVALLGSRLDYSWETIRDSRPMQFTIDLLEPPNPPADRNRRE